MRKCLAIGLVGLVFFGLASLAGAGELRLGVQYDGWSATNTLLSVNGSEVSVPFSVHFKLDDTFGVFGQANFVGANYTGTADGTTASSYSPTNFSDSVIGTDVHFNNFGLPAMLDVSFNLPSGNQDWETNQTISNIPTEFLDSRYRGRGFGVNAMYGLSFPSGGDSQFGAAVGYLYSGSYNTNEIPDLALGDSVFLGVNRVEAFGGNKSSTIRLSTLFFMKTTTNGTDLLQEGPNLNCSYAFSDPLGFSYEIGGQFFTKADRAKSAGKPLKIEPFDSLGQRFYAAPSLAIGQLTLGGIAKYVTPNDYPTSNALYDGGGLILGLTPSFTAPLDGVSDLKFTAGYDFIIAHNSGQAGSAKADIYYNYWQVGTNYEIKL